MLIRECNYTAVNNFHYNYHHHTCYHCEESNLKKQLRIEQALLPCISEVKCSNMLQKFYFCVF